MCDIIDMMGKEASTVRSKRAVIIAVFFLYIIYLIGLALKYLYKIREPDTMMQRKYRNFTNDLSYSTFGFLLLTLLMHSQAPVPFSAIIAFIYLSSVPLILLGCLQTDKFILRVAGLGLQALIVLTIIIFVLANSWCRFFFFRYSINLPSE